MNVPRVCPHVYIGAHSVSLSVASTTFPLLFVLGGDAGVQTQGSDVTAGQS